MRLHWICHHPIPSGLYLFRELAATPGVDLEVHFRVPVLESHPWESLSLEGIRSRYYDPTLGVDRHLLRLAAREPRSLFVITGWNEPTMQLVASVRAWRGLPFALLTDTPDMTSRRSPLKRLARARWLGWLFARATAVMGTGRPALSALQQMGCPAAKLIDFPYLVDLERFAPDPARASRHGAAFASTGRLIRLKGYDLALRALARVFARRGGAFSYRIAGAGPELAALRRLAKELGIAQHVEFLGWLEPPDLPGFFASADLFLHPARWEPFGIAVVEAMACGNAVIGSDATGAALDRIRPGVNGFLHRADDEGDLALQIERALALGTELARVKRAARRSAEEWPVSREIEIVTSLLERSARSA